MPRTICWCGNDSLDSFGAGYHRCPACQTLVAPLSATQADPRVKDEDADLYGRQYWFKHQTDDLNFPDIFTRARTDLADRCVHWLRTLLQFKLPPAKVLEMGCAHGGFVAMLRQAGYDATGLELSPAVVELARRSFDIPMLCGPIEDQQLPAGSFDVIILMDVMEHLPHPLATLGRCLELLKPNGMLLVQTPMYPQPQSLQNLLDDQHRFLAQLKANEHLFLYSRESAAALFGQLGTPHVQFVPAVFDFYDMFFAVSKQPLPRQSAEAIDAALCASMPGKLLRALLDLDQRRLNLLDKYRQLRDEHSALPAPPAPPAQPRKLAAVR